MVKFLQMYHVCLLKCSNPCENVFFYLPKDNDVCIANMKKVLRHGKITLRSMFKINIPSERLPSCFFIWTSLYSNYINPEHNIVIPQSSLWPTFVYNFQNHEQPTSSLLIHYKCDCYPARPLSTKATCFILLLYVQVVCTLSLSCLQKKRTPAFDIYQNSYLSTTQQYAACNHIIASLLPRCSVKKKERMKLDLTNSQKIRESSPSASPEEFFTLLLQRPFSPIKLQRRLFYVMSKIFSPLPARSAWMSCRPLCREKGRDISSYGGAPWQRMKGRGFYIPSIVNLVPPRCFHGVEDLHLHPRANLEQRNS